MKPVHLHVEAEAEVEATSAYYNGQRAGLGEEFEDEVKAGIERIARTPQTFSPHGDQGYRKHVLRRFPYTIFYLEFEDCIWVAAVAPQRKRSDYW